MTRTLLLLALLAGCDAGGTFADAGGDDDDDDPVDAGCDGDAGDGDGGPGGCGTVGSTDPWVGTATVAWTDFNGNAGTLLAEVRWEVTARDEDGAEYAPTGTVTVGYTHPTCSITFAPTSHAIDPGNDGFLRVDDDATYRGFGGTFWDAVYTIECPPSPPQSLPSMVAQQWLNTPSSRPLTDPDRISGTETMGQFEYAWEFERVPD